MISLFVARPQPLVYQVRYAFVLTHPDRVLVPTMSSWISVLGPVVVTQFAYLCNFRPRLQFLFFYCLLLAAAAASAVLW